MRFRIPSSRAMVRLIAMLVNVAVITEKTMIAGVKKRPPSSPPPKSTLKITMNRSGKTKVKKAAAGLRQKARFS
jgi:hypothetical protein